VQRTTENWRQPEQMQVEVEWGCRGMKKRQFSEKNNKSTFPIPSIVIPTTLHSCTIEENFISGLSSLKKEETKLMVEMKQLLDTLDQLQAKLDIITDERSNLLASMEENLLSELQNSKSKASYALFSVVTWGSSWPDGLVFTVMAENDAWAKKLVRQWLNSNGRENHRIDKVRALVSRNVRAVINVGAQLLDV
jgi:hypothetical protein